MFDRLFRCVGGMFVCGLLVVSGLFAGQAVPASAAAVNEQFQVSKGVSYKDVRFNNGKVKNAVRVLDVNLLDPYTKVDIGLPLALNRLDPTTQQALRHHQPGNLVVGAVNGGFFYGEPLNLLAEDNRLVHAGKIYGSKSNYVNEPIAFGVNKDGHGLIDYYNLDLKYIHNGKEYKISSTNREREPDNTILYTSYFSKDFTNTNEWGTEVVVSLPSAPTLEFGTKVTGKVEKIRKLGEKTKTTIPANGFVLSGHGIGREHLEKVKVGDEITLSVDIDSKWKQSEFMIVSGPMLVKDGKPHITMNPNAPEVKDRHPRTAVAVNKTGDKVFFVTVDGRQAASSGMTMPELANYLISLGADRALNLDGGGSTAMAVRYPGEEKVRLANSPSDGRERSVSTILMAVSTAPVGKAQTFKLKKSKEGPLVVGEKLSFSVASAVDEYGNPMKPGDVALQLEDVNGLGEVQGNQFVAKREGKGTIKVVSGQAVATFPIEIEDPAKNIFTDVRSGYWARDQILDAVEREIVKGYDDRTFRPERTVTRAEFVSMITRALGTPSSGALPAFKDGGDVPGWAKEAFAAAYHAEIIEGYDDGTIRPNKKISRTELAVMISRALELQRTSDGPIGFADDDFIEKWAAASVAALKDHGLITGKEDNRFAPKDETKRAEAAVLLLRVVEK